MLHRLLVFVALTASVARGQTSVKTTSTPSPAEPTCFQSGECMDSLYIGMWTPDDAQGCLTECQNDEDCHYFTYYEDLGECTGFYNCEAFSEVTCTNCYSGSEDCEDLTCWVLGECDGILYDEVAVETSQECADACKANGPCQWFTFEAQASVCVMLENCPYFENDCTTCISGQKQCSDRRDFSKLMVIGGYTYTDGPLDVVEVIDLDDPNSMCTIVANYPIEVGDMTVTYVNGVVKSCGGEDYNDCYEYHSEDNVWVSTAGLLDGRSGVRSSLIDGTWLISGSNVDPIGTQTEMWVEDHFQPGPMLPELMAAHCQTTINATHIFFADCYDQTAYLFNWSEQEWIQVDNMEIDRDYDCGCGLIRSDANGKEYVVAGFGTSEIFNFDTMSWREGPTLTYGYGYASVQMENTFALVGGYESDYMDKIYIFDQDNYEFALKSQRLQHARAYAGAVAVPDSAVNCS